MTLAARVTEGAYDGGKQCDNQLKQVIHSDTNPRPGQYLTHAHSHITRAVAAMDSCFGLVRPHFVSISIRNRTYTGHYSPVSLRVSICHRTRDVYGPIIPSLIHAVKDVGQRKTRRQFRCLA